MRPAAQRKERYRREKKQGPNSRGREKNSRIGNEEEK